MKAVCVACGLETRVVAMGLTLVEMFGWPPRPYATWQADELECPKCLRRVVGQFAEKATMHFAEGFADELLRQTKQRPHTIRVCWEKDGHALVFGRILPSEAVRRSIEGEPDLVSLEGGPRL